MSHSKHRKKEKSIYLDSWNPGAKKYIVNCVICGTKGYKLSLLEPDFEKTPLGKPIKDEIIKIYNPLDLDENGLCDQCAEIKNINK